MLINALRGHLAEFGIVAPRGIQKVDELAAVVADESDGRLPASARNSTPSVLLYENHSLLGGTTS